MADASDLAERLQNCGEAGLSKIPISKKVCIPTMEKNAYLKAQEQESQHIVFSSVFLPMDNFVHT